VAPTLLQILGVEPPAYGPNQLVATERHRHPAGCPELAAAAGISERRADELLRAVRAEDQQP
jgi:hypothetical protein